MDEAADPFLWLEDVEGEKALDWVKARNAETLGILQADPRYAKLHGQALAILHAKDRVPWGSIGKNDRVSNFWQDEANVRGLWRRTTLRDYRTAEPSWETILDFDALAARENRNWVYKGGSSLRDSFDYACINLSDGGKDASEFREFNQETKTFNPDGFNGPEGKHRIAWLDKDTLLIAPDLGEGSLTKSGYPYTVKKWTRGQRLEDAVEIFRGTQDDTSVGFGLLCSSNFEVQAILLHRNLNFYDTETYILTEQGPRRLPLPKRVSAGGLVKDQLLLSLDEDWPEQDLKAGDLASCDFALLKDKNQVKSQLIFRPGPTQSLSQFSITRNKLVIDILDNVQGEIHVCDYAGDAWISRKLDLPPNSDVGVSGSTNYDNRIAVSLDNFLTPSSELLIDLDTGDTETLKTAPVRFDASAHVSEQHHAVSKDGTPVPYFVVRPKDAVGPAPTLLYAYGGFQISMRPGYGGILGKLWLERGGTYVLANIRGGGEFGPAWHEAGRKQNRQLVFDDFFAVSQDLIARGIATADTLGIQGGSNGGLLMGVALTQHPELYRAIVCQVPLLDMLRYTVMGGAGASWAGEYGDPEIPEERAALEAYSPYQALKPDVAYPETLIMTSTKDDRVHPGHARKMAARLMELGQPVLYYENIDGGHGGAANLLETAMQSALVYTYLSRRLGLP
jgi:prolyl oligopeptidase